MTAPGTHEFSVATRTDKTFVTAPIRYRAECQCGFVGEYRRSPEEAEGDGFGHKAMAISPPPDLPRAA